METKTNNMNTADNMDTNNIVITKKGFDFIFFEEIRRNSLRLSVKLGEETKEVSGMSETNVNFQFPISKHRITGLNSVGVDPTLWKSLKKKYEEIKQKRKEIEIEIENEKYRELTEKINSIPLPRNNINTDDEKAQELLKKQNNFCSNESEDEGIMLSISNENAKIRKEAQKICNHEFKINLNRSLTQDIRRKIERTVVCEKCGFSHTDIVQEKTDFNKFD